MIFQAKVCGDFAWSSWSWIFALDGLQGAITPNKVILHCCRLDQARRRWRSNSQKPEFGSPVQCSRHALKMTGQVSVPFFDIVCNSENKFQSTFFLCGPFCLETSRKLLNLNLFTRQFKNLQFSGFRGWLLSYGFLSCN
jgi:hypothetical protein